MATAGIASPSATRASFTGRTAWARNLAAPVRDFLGAETGGAMVLLCAAVAALAVGELAVVGLLRVVLDDEALDPASEARASPLDLRHWVNEGLMTFFFLVVGLEAKRELDTGELRERRRLAIPVVAAVGGMAVPIAIYLAFNAGGSGAHGWGAAMSTDTAFALGVLALVAPGRHAPARSPAHARRGRRPRGAGGDRHRLHGACLARAARGGRRPLRRCCSALRYAPTGWRRPGRRGRRRRPSGWRCSSPGSIR